MNSLCFVCQDPCTRVCTHSKCTPPPFFCSGPCNKGISLKMHTHEGTQQYIAYNQLQQKLVDFQNLQNPQIVHQKYFNQIQKKSNITKTYIEDQLKQIDILIKQHKQELCGISDFFINQQTISNLKKISQDKTGESLTGQQIKNIFSTYNNIFEDYSYDRIKTLQSGFKEGFDTLCKLKFSSMFLNLEKISQSCTLYYQGQAFLSKKQAEKALEKFLEAIQLNRFDDGSYFQMGRCYSLLGDLDKSLQSFEKSLLLNQKDYETYGNIGRVHYNKGNYEEAVKWCEKSIEKGNDTANFWAFKGTCYIQWKKYPEAITCYEKASSKDAENEDYKYNVQWLKQTMEKEKEKKKKKNQKK